jgi:hypothetical protein
MPLAFRVFGGRGQVFEIIRDGRGADALGQQGQDLERARDVADPGDDEFAGVDMARGFGVLAVDLDMAGIAGGGGLGSGRVDADRPEPFVEPDFVVVWE